MASLKTSCRVLQTSRHLPVFNPRAFYRSYDRPQKGHEKVPSWTIEKHRDSPLNATRVESERLRHAAPTEFRYIFPEFLPHPDWKKRDRVAEKLQRRDMLRRRLVLDIPEFYVGSILGVTVADQHVPSKQSRFVGICIHRDGHGLRANFTLRNHIDGQGVEIKYDLYNPTLQNIEVLKLEKRLDEELFYLRDAPATHSTITFDRKPETLPLGATVPVNMKKIPLNPPPWTQRWEKREDLKGIDLPELPEKRMRKLSQIVKPWEKYDLMKEYRKNISEEEQNEIFKEVVQHHTRVEKKRHQERLKRMT
ncbi:39S ribosomal protein L19, mitochondrial isoform X1 [Lingula anatina]|uniref:Large ribosomal subunit protein bL19m n=1 Tax=Lingula anatina TaxID=7574 RepID=A0A1S3HBI4_LINAN|nr:39S ribosomal protein L19, mitochondrial isoform X1 [Lingula anatina]|eukprot:XP_013382494.1 39S ribosomal protein L19, mitochondrial isoform X1 [Lingula anatina]